MLYNIIMKTKTYTVFEIHSKELVNNWYPYWTAEIRKKIPANMVVTDKEIYSEITHNCIYLSSLFKAGSFPAYCNMYVVQLSVKSFWTEYKKLDHACIAEAYDDFDNGESFEEQHDVVKESMRNKSSEQERHEKTRKLTMLYQAAAILDKKTDNCYEYANIIDDIRMGMSLADIAEEMHTNKMDISRRFADIKDEVNKLKTKENEIWSLK